MINGKIRSPSSLKLSDMVATTAETPIRVVTKGLNYFDVYRDPVRGYTAKSIQNGSIYVSDTIAEMKFYIGCSL